MDSTRRIALVGLLIRRRRLDFETRDWGVCGLAHCLTPPERLSCFTILPPASSPSFTRLYTTHHLSTLCLSQKDRPLATKKRPALAMSNSRYERVWNRISHAIPILSGIASSEDDRANDTLLCEKQVAGHDEDDSPVTSSGHQQHFPIPSSPPPSFRSRNSSPNSRHHPENEPLVSDRDRTLADTFDSPSDEEDSDNGGDDGLDDRQRLMRGNPTESAEPSEAGNAHNSENPRQAIQRRVTQLPAFIPQPTSGGRVIGGGGNNDGVFANLSAKPTRGEQEDEKPPVRT